MKISKRLKTQIEEIVHEMDCPKDFACYRSGFTDLCKVKKAATSPWLVCSEVQPQRCRFALPIGHAYFCQCRLRHYVAKALGIYVNGQPVV
ncbi:MAG: hypothetical protein ACYSUB_21750 [Planctomycetota bacterium]|jgi:hypothetical protein